MENSFSDFSNSVVKVITSSGTGSGFYLAKENLIVTNFHVVEGSQVVAIETHDKHRCSCQVLIVNPAKDIALIRPSQNLTLKGLKLNPAGQVQIRDKVIVAGFPLGMPLSVTEGVISSVKQNVSGTDYLQTDAAINPGNSGGPLLNQAGEVIGMTTCKFNSAENMGFALPIAHVIEDLSTTLSQNLDRFSVKCGSCGHVISEPQDNCPACGVELNIVGLFEERPISALATFVESALVKAGYNPVETRLGMEYWEFYRGSAMIRIFVFGNDYLFATCPLVGLPKANFEPLFKFLLGSGAHPYYLGLMENIVYVSYRVAIVDCLQSSRGEEIQNFLAKLTTKADELDDFLIEKFGCVPSTFSKFPNSQAS